MHGSEARGHEMGQGFATWLPSERSQGLRKNLDSTVMSLKDFSIQLVELQKFAQMFKEKIKRKKKGRKKIRGHLGRHLHNLTMLRIQNLWNKQIINKQVKNTKGKLRNDKAVSAQGRYNNCKCLAPSIRTPRPREQGLTVRKEELDS